MLGLGPRCRRFESCRLDHLSKAVYAGVAQLVEQLICNQQVGGSSPSTSSISFFRGTISYGRVPEWPKGADCKSVVSDFDGSNPSSPTKIKTSHTPGGFCFMAEKHPPPPAGEGEHPCGSPLNCFCPPFRAGKVWGIYLCGKWKSHAVHY